MSRRELIVAGAVAVLALAVLVPGGDFVLAAGKPLVVPGSAWTPTGQLKLTGGGEPGQREAVDAQMEFGPMPGGEFLLLVGGGAGPLEVRGTYTEGKPGKPVCNVDLDALQSEIQDWMVPDPTVLRADLRVRLKSKGDYKTIRVSLGIKLLSCGRDRNDRVRCRKRTVRYTGLQKEPINPEERALKDLGVDTDPGPRLSAVDGKPIPEDRHPLGSAVTALAPTSELYGFGFPYRSGYVQREFLLDDPISGARDLISPPGDDAEWFIRVTAADVDGNHLEEIVTVFLSEENNSLMLRVRDDAENSYAVSVHTFLADLGDLEPLYETLSSVDIAAGDVDGDGSDELLITVPHNSTLYVLDDELHDFALLDSETYPFETDRPAVDVDDIRIAAADLDGDARAEIAVARSRIGEPITLATWFLYGFGEGGLAEIDHGDLVHPVDDETRIYHAADVTAADLDGDGLPELVFTGRPEISGRTWLVLVMEDGTGSGDLGQKFRPHEILERSATVDGFLWIGGDTKPAAGDIDGDRRDEIFFLGRFLDFEAGRFMTRPGDPYRALPWISAAVMGDFDGEDTDGRQDVAFVEVGNAPSEDWHLVIVGAPPGDSEIVERARFGPISRRESSYMLVAANADADTRVVGYEGPHEVIYSEPIVIAVLASAPYHDGVRHADGATVLGDSTTVGREASHAVGGNVGVTIGASAQSPMWGSAGSFEGKVTVSIAADFLWAGGHEFTYSSAIENPSGQDLVIFTAIPYDAYVYRVLASPKPEEVGELFTINIPRDPQVHHLERDYYNAHNGTASDVDASILGHTVGDPWSYPTRAERTAMVEKSRFLLQSRDDNPPTCSGGGATSKLGVEWSRSHALGFAVDVSIQSEVETVTGGLLLGISGGYHFGVEVLWHWSDKIFIEGAVGDVKPRDWEPVLGFQWGLFAFERELAGQAHPVTVVTYWVE